MGVEIESRAIAVREEVKGACEMLGIDPCSWRMRANWWHSSDPGTADAVLQSDARHKRRARCGESSGAR